MSHWLCCRSAHPKPLQTVWYRVWPSHIKWLRTKHCKGKSCKGWFTGLSNLSLNQLVYFPQLKQENRGCRRLLPFPQQEISTTGINKLAWLLSLYFTRFAEVFHANHTFGTEVRDGRSLRIKAKCQFTAISHECKKPTWSTAKIPPGSQKDISNNTSQNETTVYSYLSFCNN